MAPLNSQSERFRDFTYFEENALAANVEGV